MKNLLVTRGSVMGFGARGSKVQPNICIWPNPTQELLAKKKDTGIHYSHNLIEPICGGGRLNLTGIKKNTQIITTFIYRKLKLKKKLSNKKLIQIYFNLGLSVEVRLKAKIMIQIFDIPRIQVKLIWIAIYFQYDKSLLTTS